MRKGTKAWRRCRRFGRLIRRPGVRYAAFICSECVLIVTPYSFISCLLMERKSVCEWNLGAGGRAGAIWYKVSVKALNADIVGTVNPPHDPCKI